MEVESAADTEIVCQRFQDAAHHAGAHPLLKPAVTGLVGRVAFRQIGPRSARTQNVENSVEHGPPVLPGAATAIPAAFRFRNQGVQKRPLGVGQVSGVVGRHPQE